MRAISDKEFIKFIFSKDDEDIFEMTQYRIDCPCGCLMVQFAKENDIDADFCGKAGFFKDADKDPIASLDRTICDYVDELSLNKVEANTYGELKQNLKRMSWAKEYIPA